MRVRRSVILWVVFGLLTLGGLYWILKSSFSEREAGAPRSEVFRLVIAAPQPLEEPPPFKVRQGDRVTFVFSSNLPGEAHVHGYEKKVILEPGGEVALTFTATDAGLFALHLHDPDGAMHGLATLEVDPR